MINRERGEGGGEGLRLVCVAIFCSLERKLHSSVGDIHDQGSKVSASSNVKCPSYVIKL